MKWQISNPVPVRPLIDDFRKKFLVVFKTFDPPEGPPPGPLQSGFSGGHRKGLLITGATLHKYPLTTHLRNTGAI
jgi:hypothetical protein